MTTQTATPTAKPDLAPVGPFDWRLVAGLAALKLLLHAPGLFRYGYFRDELYFLDCGRHLSLGYIDHAPLVGLYAKVALLLGGSLPALRWMPAVAGTGMVVLTVLIARQLGGGRWAQGLAGLAVIVAPVHLMIASVLSMNAFEPLFWMGCAYVVLRIVRTGNSRLWLAFGVIAGLGLENKHSMLFFGAAAALAVVLTPLRRELARPWIWLGGGVALLLFLPNLLWQWTHGFPTLVDLSNVRESGKNVALAPLAFFVQQVFMMHPVTVPVWLSGLWFLLFGRGRAFRALGWAFVALFGMMLALHGKDYYLAPAYPMLLAAGGVAIEGWLSRLAGRPMSFRVARAGIPTLVVGAGAVFAPLALPVLSPESYVAYQHRLGVAPQRTEVAHVGPLPQLWGDQFGWPELVGEVAHIWRALPDEERTDAAIFASNYGEAGAINLFGPALGLPAAVCAHQTHSMWGPPDSEPSVVIWLQWEREWLEPRFASVEQVGSHHHPWGMAEENRPIYLCRQPKMTWREAWPGLTHWN